jgi:hypothetical protein
VSFTAYETTDEAAVGGAFKITLIQDKGTALEAFERC